MEKKLIFEGVATALITPFTDGGDIDFACLGRLIDMQIEGDWVGKANPKDYPVEMRIDWVKMYQWVGDR
jgi:hypothetical protein